MEALKTPIEINKIVVEALERQKGTLGFAKRYGWLVVIQDYKVEEKPVVHKRWALFGHKETTETTYYLTEAKFHIWNVKHQSWTHLSEEGINAILYDDDILRLRTNYLTMIKAPLEFLGVKFKNKSLNE